MINKKNIFYNHEFVCHDGKKFNFDILKNTFVPTGTSNLLLKSILNYKIKPGKTLDLGAGIGIIGLLLFKYNFIKEPLFLSDISEESLICIKQNAKKFHCSIDARLGSMFDPWQNEKFDLIINDVSGISEEVAKISPWFKNVPCNSGEDGTKLTNIILNRAKNFLNPTGLLFFPVISLSKSEKIIFEAKKNFKNVIEINTQEWPFPKDIAENKKLSELKKRKLIDYKEKFGIKIFSTTIYVAHN